MSAEIGLIVGSGLDALDVTVDWQSAQTRDTPFGLPSSAIARTQLGGQRVAILARHGPDHSIAPDRVNYRANVWALKEAGCRALIGVNVVGAIAPGFRPGDVAIPDQLIDYTWGRDATFGDLGDGIPHIDFTDPFDPELRGHLATAAAASGLNVHGGICAVTQGPRLETAAEIDRLERDGCAMVGMTVMPEAALARELGLRYALVAAAVNFAAGRSPSGMPLHRQMEVSLAVGMSRIAGILDRSLAGIRATL